MTQSERWIPFLALALTVIGAAIGLAWRLGATMATAEDFQQLRQEISQDIARGQERSDAQLAEIRGYIVGHPDKHDTP